LTTAFYLSRYGVNVRVYEKSDRPGGVIETSSENGFIFEAGPNTGVLNRPEAVELFDDLSDDCKLEVADEAAKARWIWKNGKWEPLPSGLISGITTPLFTFNDKLRLLAEPFRKKGDNPDETLAGLVLRRMGRSFLNYAIDPFILGIYSGDPGKLVTQYAFPKLYWLEQDYGSFIGGAVKKSMQPKDENEKKVTKEIFSVEGGLNNLISALVKNIGEENIQLQCSGLQFTKSGEEFISNYDNRKFTHVISATGGYELKNLFPFIPEKEVEAINKMEYSQVVQVSVGFKKWNGILLNAFGGLVPSIENRKILGILFISSFLKNRAPRNGALLSVFLGGVRKPEMSGLSDNEIKKIVEDELKPMLKIEEFSPDLIKIFRYKHAIPQYGLESAEKLKVISSLEEKFPGLILGGNIRDGIGIADRIKQGKNIANQLIKK
ncbi:MAG: protoporphyrinogen oxidase, partial [Bacteroidales bacterium]|nr:protoporphyrinogen oxidase [Bacteroidales bacterium]